MALGELYLGLSIGSLQLLTAFSREFRTGNIQLSRSERTASGKMVRDIIATKKKFTLSYDLIDGEELDVFKDLYNEDAELAFRVFISDVDYLDYVILMDPLDWDRVLMFDTGLWSNVEVSLVEV